MKKNAVILTILVLFILLIPASIIEASREQPIIGKTGSVAPGEIIAAACTHPYPTLGQPVHLIITVEGRASQQFNQTIVITDEFSGLVTENGQMRWISSNITVTRFDMTIGLLPRYIKKILWYPSVVGNHTFHITAGSFPKKQLNISVGFDVEGIITPSLGCPALIIKNNTGHLSVTLSEERERPEEPAKILHLELQDIDDATSYILENQTAIWQTWVETGIEMVEDELIVSYDVSSIPEGFYNISVTTTKQNYSWPHAVKLLQTEPTEFRIVQLTDIHIGKYSNFVNKKKELIRLFTYINENIHPDFVIISGDLVDWYNKRAKRNVYLEFQEALLYSDAPVYTTPGNHERYSNSLLFLYVPYTNLTPYHRFLNPLNDYSVTYGNVNFVFLDSGYDYSRWEIKPRIWNPTPETSGLTNTQMYLLETIWGNAQMNQVITMHHPAVNDKNDTGLGALPNDLPSGNDECIAFNRGEFISYCLQNNVSVILSGHTHKNRVFTYLGKEPENPTAWPLFLHTDSATLNRMNNGGRIITIKNGAVVDYDYIPFI
jgi:predicted MPP superfamily phosphohydrolase